MKKLFIFLIVILLAFAGFLTWLSYQPETHMALTEEEAPAYSGEMSEEAAEAVVSTLDYDAIRTLHADDEIVMTVCGKDISWGEYYTWFYMNGKQVESYFEQMAMYYGVAADWTGSTGDGLGTTYAQLPALSTEDTLQRFAAVEKLAAEKGIALSDESLAQLEDQALAEAIIGEGATVEQLNEALQQMYMDIDGYKRITAINLLYSDMLNSQYGENCELVDEAAVALWLGEQNYVSANHILFMTMDKATGEKVDEASAAEKKALAEEVYAELSAIGDVEELIARFKELKEQYDEDTGKTYYPDGYTYTPGTMVSEFEAAVNSMEAYDVSEPVETSYGYHVIMRMPLSSQNLLSDESGSLIPAGWVYAQQQMNAEVEAIMSEEPITYAEGFEAVNVLDFIK